MIGTKIDNLEVIEIISNQGCFGEVCKVKDYNDDNEKAIKIFRTERGPVEETRFKAENEILHKLQPHENIIMPLSKVLTSKQYIYYILELADYNLSNYVLYKPDLPATKRLEIFKQICEGLRHAHSKTIVHRDLHDRNILIKVTNCTDTAKLTDFGRARDFMSPSVTTPFSIWGAIAISAPEVISQVVNLSSQFSEQARVDFYSLGIILHCVFERLPMLFTAGILDLHESANQRRIYSSRASSTDRNYFYDYCINYFEKEQLCRYLEVTIPIDEKLNNKINKLIRAMAEPHFSKRLCNFDDIQIEVQDLIEATKHV